MKISKKNNKPIWNMLFMVPRINIDSAAGNLQPDYSADVWATSRPWFSAWTRPVGAGRNVVPK